MRPLLAVRSNSVNDIDNALSRLDDLFKQTLRGCVATAVSPATASLPFTVPHTLGAVPDWAIGIDDTGTANLGVADTDATMWSDKAIVVRSPFASTKYRILIVAVS